MIKFLNKGFSLLELVVVIAVITILASVAYPSYLDSIRKARRADGVAALATVQMAQQKLRSNCRFYAQNLGANNVCGASAAESTIRASEVSLNGRYSVALSEASGTGYTITATGLDGQAHDSEGGTVCTLSIQVGAENPDGARTPTVCWD